MPTDLPNSVVPAEMSSSSLLALLRLALKHGKLVTATALAIVLLSVAIALLLPNLYTATVVLMPPQQSGPSGSAMMAQLGNLGAMASMGAGGLGIKNPNDLQVAFLKSVSVEDAMAARFNLQQLYRRKYLSTTRKRWERATKVDNGLKDGLIRLSVTDTDPRRAAEMANGWVEEYKRFSATLAVTEASQRRLFYERELIEAHEALARAEEDMKQTQQRTGVIEIEGQARAMIASASLLRAQVATKQMELRAMREFATDQNPDLIRTEQELSSLESQLAAMDLASDRKGGDLVMPKGQATEASMDYARALREMKYREMVVELLMRQYEGARVDEARRGAQVQIVDPAAAPDRPLLLYKILVALGGVLGALPLALLLALGAELFSTLLARRRRAGSWYGALEDTLAGAAL